ncbi:MAG: DUF6265 family protein [Acidobacteriota bacterium]
MKPLIPLVALLLSIPAGAVAADLPGWMAGAWGGEVGGVAMEEHWTSGGGSLMVGMHRDLRAEGKASFEFLRIEKKDGTLVYLSMPSGRPATPFPLKTISPQKVVFENPQHDFPQRILYWRDGARLCARIEGTIKGEVEGEQWCWSKLPK